MSSFGNWTSLTAASAAPPSPAPLPSLSPLSLWPPLLLLVASELLMAAATLPTLLHLLLSSGHQSGYPIISKHPSLVCFVFPQTVHLSFDLSMRDDEPLPDPDRRRPCAAISTASSPVTLRPPPMPCCDVISSGVGTKIESRAASFLTAAYAASGDVCCMWRCRFLKSSDLAPSVQSHPKHLARLPLLPSDSLLVLSSPNSVAEVFWVLPEMADFSPSSVMGVDCFSGEPTDDDISNYYLRIVTSSDTMTKQRLIY